MKYPLAIFIGRFQPFHKGHLYALKQAVEHGQDVLIGIGSSEQSGTESNPWSYEVRKKMVERVVNEERLSKQVVGIVGIADTESDKEWVSSVVEIVKGLGYRVDEVVVVSNNSWVTETLSEVGMAVVRQGFYQRDKLEGVKIREMIFLQAQDRLRYGLWQERVEPEVVEIIEELL